ncbi:MAG TPA: hypothetical protein VMH04_09815 [Candidatus Solibacter sp.]|nr:hypothetical protein [Candidatus Solibacter sp.]
MPEIERSREWMVAAVIPAIAFIAGLGPGFKFLWGYSGYDD